VKEALHVSQVSRGQAYAILSGAALMMTFAISIRQNLGRFQAPAARIPGRPLPHPRGAPDEARRHGGHLVMAAAFFVCGLQLVFLTTHLPTCLAQCGMDPSYGAVALMLIGGFNILSSWLFGWLGDRYPKRLLLGAIYVVRSLALALFFSFPPTPLSVVLFGAVMGTLWLGVVPLVNGLVVKIFGLRFLSTLTGLAFLSPQAGSFLGAWGGGYLFDLMGSCDLA
jgi:predicted MFS family arabinose efflux permease